MWCGQCVRCGDITACTTIVPARFGEKSGQVEERIEAWETPARQVEVSQKIVWEVVVGCLVRHLAERFRSGDLPVYF